MPELNFDALNEAVTAFSTEFDEFLVVVMAQAAELGAIETANEGEQVKLDAGVSNIRTAVTKLRDAKAALTPGPLPEPTEEP